MNNKMVFGQYYNTNSIIHRVDPRVKIVITLLFMVSIFLVPLTNFYLLGGMLLITLITIILTRVPIINYLKSLKQIMFLLVFTLVFQILFRQTGNLLFSYTNSLTWLNISISLAILILYFIFRRYLPVKGLVLLAIVIGIIYLLGFPIYGNIILTYDINIYDSGLYNGAFIILRVLVLIMFTTILTLTTKPTTLNNAIESLLSPLEKLHIKTSIFAMMISIALRFIPTLFLEADKILKAQASRGVDFNEGRLKDKIVQIVSLLVPMFIVSFKRADDLSIAMEARGYVPGEKRTKINQLKLRFIDVIWLILFLGILTFLIIWRVMV